MPFKNSSLILSGDIPSKLLSSDNDFEDESSNYIDEVRSASSESLVEDDEY